MDIGAEAQGLIHVSQLSVSSAEELLLPRCCGAAAAGNCSAAMQLEAMGVLWEMGRVQLKSFGGSSFDRNATGGEQNLHAHQATVPYRDA